MYENTVSMIYIRFTVSSAHTMLNLRLDFLLSLKQSLLLIDTGITGQDCCGSHRKGVVWLFAIMT